MEKRNTFDLTRLIPVILYLISLVCLGQINSSDFPILITIYCISFILFIWTVIKWQKTDNKSVLVFYIISLIVCSVPLPNLSNDYFRFLWDGLLPFHNINPFDYKPFEINGIFDYRTDYIRSLLDGMSSLSFQNYSVYPPFNQVYFIVSSAFSENLFINISVLRALIGITEFLGLIYLIKILGRLKLPTSVAFMILLNPLFLTETIINVHFEGVMISWIIIALWSFMNGNILFGSLFLTLAIQIKLLPLILLPFLWRLLGIQKSLAVYLLILGFNIWISLPFLGPENIFHLLEAIKLYFGNFEFNSLVLYNYVQYGKWKLGWNPVKYYAPYLSRVAVKIILVTSLYGEYSQWEKFFRRVTIGLFAYLLLTSTVHPWYLVSLLLFSILSGYVFAIVWSITVFLSYVIYSDIDFSVQRTLIILEYIPVLILFTYEMIKGGLLFKWLPQDSFSEDFSSLGGTGS